MPQAEKALVIGASGFLGSHLVKELAKQGYKVRILARKSSNLEAINGIDYEKCIGDVMDQESLQKAMAGCDWVFHSAVDTRAGNSHLRPLKVVATSALRYPSTMSSNSDSTRNSFSSGLEVLVMRDKLASKSCERGSRGGWRVLLMRGQTA